MSTQLKTQRDRFVAFAFAAADLLLEIDGRGVVIYAAGAATRFIGRDAAQIVGMHTDEIFGPSGKILLSFALESLKAGDRLEPVIIPSIRPDGTERLALLGGCRLPKRPDSAYLTLSATRASAAIGTSVAGRDESSGLLAKKEFPAVARDAVLKARAAGLDPEMTVLELTGFADFRDRLGAEQVEGFLRGIGGYLRGRSIGDAAARLGDAKYGIMHDVGLNKEAIEQDIVRLSRLADPAHMGVSIDSTSIEVGSDVGDEDVARALVFTINKLAEASAANLNVRSMAGAVRSMLDETLDRITDFRRMVAKGTTRHLLQPIVALGDRRLHHSELLVRFEDGKSPQNVIGFAENLGIIPELDIEICRAAIDILVGDREIAPIAVNISAHSVGHEPFVSALVDLLRRASLGERLIFEITESAELTDLAAANAVIGRLRALGHKVCLDDFGAGAAGFSYLQALDVDYVKFDGKYIRQVVGDPRSRMMLKAMAGLCRDLGVETVGEMIETEEQAVILRNLGIGFGQGYLFGKPSPTLPKAAPLGTSEKWLYRAPVRPRKQSSREPWS